jgi:hypothetical protein
MTFDYQKTFPWSNYHFDSGRVEPRTYLAVGRFDLDFAKEIELSQSGIEWTWGGDLDNLDNNNNPYEITGLAKKVARLPGTANVTFEVNELSHVDTFKKMAASLGLKDPVSRVHLQGPGNMLSMHVDFLKTKTSMKAYKDPNAIRRFAVMLTDWKFGQVFQFGTHTWTNWRAGDCVTWNWSDMPHATCNMGYEDRYMLQLTGTPTELTDQILATASSDRIILLCDSY